MDISWDDARLFLAVADAGSLSAAAKKLRVAQPTVSRRLAELEASLGEPLFVRSVEGATPTSFAEKLLVPARRMAEWAAELSHAAEKADASPRGVVRITAPPGVAFDVMGTTVELQQIVRDVALVGVAFLSLAITPKGVREKNLFTWAPMQEVAKLFIGIFITMVPVLAMLRAGADGPFAAVVHAVTDDSGAHLPWAYFWFTGVLSSFLDNAPTYLVFFNLAGGDPVALMTATTWL